jgi:hypothetical protein
MAPEVTSSVRLNASESTMFLRQLEHIKPQIINVEYTALKARTLIPASFEADPADEYITWRQYDKVGKAKVIRDYSTDLPRVDVKGAEERAKVRSLGASYGYSIQEIRASQKTGKSLDARRAMTAREAILREEDNIAWFGDSVNNLNGLLTNGNITQVIVPSDGTGTTTTWSTKTADQIVRDMNLVANTIVESTKGIEQPDTLLLPLSLYNIAATTRLPNTAITCLSFFLQTNPFIKNVDWLQELAGSGVDGKNRILAYRRDPLKLTMEIPQDYEQFEPEIEGLEYKVACHSRFGGVIIFKPMSIAYADGC